MRGEFIDPGALRHELSLEQATLSPDGAGGHTEGWNEVATVFARIEPIFADSRFGADQTVENGALPDVQGQGGWAVKVSMRMTLDGLVRTLRARAHQMADEIESGYLPPEATPGAERPGRPKARAKGTDDDDFSDA